MGPIIAFLQFLLHAVHVGWIRLNRWLSGSKLPPKAHGIVIIGDELAEGIGDYVTFGQVPGLARHLQDKIRASPKIKQKKHWIVRSAGVAGATSTSWLPKGATRWQPPDAASGSAGPNDKSIDSADSKHEADASASKSSKKAKKKKKKSKHKDRSSKNKKKKDVDGAGFKFGALWESTFGPKGNFADASIVIVAVGSNDYKHGETEDPDATRHNICRICTALVARKKKVFVVGLRRVMHVKESVNLHRNSLVRDYCRMANAAGVKELQYGPNLHIGSWEQPQLVTSGGLHFNSAGYSLLVRVGVCAARCESSV